MNLEDAVARACARLAVTGIEGWGMDMAGGAGTTLFDVVQVGPVKGCADDRCHHQSHDPAAPILRYIPRQGTLVALGWNENVAYYALRGLPDHDRFLCVTHPRHFHASIEIVGAEQVPEYLLAALAAGA